MDIKLVVFDWSGTVSDDIKPVYETYTRMAEKFKLKVLSFDEWKGAVTADIDEFFRNQGIEGDVGRLWKTYEETFVLSNAPSRSHSPGTCSSDEPSGPSHTKIQ